MSNMSITQRNKQMNTSRIEVRPHGHNSRLGALPAKTLEEACNLQRVFGGDIIDTETGWHY
jgi:serine protease inhibitor ecotin